MVNRTENISVLIPDGEDNLLLNVVYSLSLKKNVKIYVLSSKRQHYMKYSSFIERYSFYPGTNDKDWINNINNQVEKHNIDVIMPVYDTGFSRIIKNKHLLKKKDKLCSLPSLSKFESARNKDLLYLHLKANDLPCPQSVIIKPKELTKSVDLEFPIVAKPVVGFYAGVGVKVLKSNEDIVGYFKSKTFGCNIIFQRFVEGYDICCNVLCENGEIIAYSMQKAGIHEEGKLTPQLDFSFVNEDSLFVIIKKLIKSLDWSGVANIDCRYDINEGTYKIIEINTRFWVNTEASAMAGVNFPYLYCLSSLNHKFDIHVANKMTYLHLKGLLKRLIKNPMFILKTGYIRKNTPLIFVIKDSIPTICKFIWRTKNIVAKKMTNN